MGDERYEDDLSTPTEAELNECYGSKYLSAADLGDKKIRTRIAKVRKEAMRQQSGSERSRFVLYFTTLDKPMVLNATNKNALTDKLGTVPADWINTEIGLYIESTTFAGKPVKGLRLKVLSGPKKATPIAPTKTPTSTAEPVKTEAWDSEDPGNFGEAAE